MYIEPNTIIRLLQDVRLDNTYENTIYFASVSAQRDYFIGKTKHTLVNNTYQRVNKGSMKVKLSADKCYDCNYMMFQNSAYGNKWFYAFITRVEYVNNGVTQIDFELDEMQTWFFETTLLESFVEREHSTTDVIGSNLVPENLELGEYVNSSFESSGHIRDYKIVIGATVQEEGFKVTGGMYSNIYSGVYYNVFDNYADANAWIEDVTTKGKSDGIVSVFMMPNDFITDIGASAKSYEITITKNTNTIDGYTPRNKKLFTHPYNFLYVSNLDGNYAEYPYEYFSTTNCVFTMAGDFSCNPTVVIYPNNYKGNTANIDEKLSLNGFPQCTWNTDVYKAWVARSATSELINLSTGVTYGMMTGNPVTIASSVGGALAKQYEHGVMPRQAHGSQANTTMVALRIKDFAFIKKHITYQFASMIDEYFDLYGYATHRVVTPNRTSRPYWNYVKTIGCNLVANAPADSVRKIKSIYDNGVRFWKNGDNIGNYSLDNSV